jgi:uncharacterized protein involved in exopolysaccharide biosynthesis
MGMPEPTTPLKPLWHRIAWMALIWVASVAALGVVAMLIRLLMSAAGMRS